MPDELRLIIGTAPDCDIRIEDDYASARHAELTIFRDERMSVQDLGSTNGTRADGVPVYGPTPLGTMSVLRVGRTTLTGVGLLRAAARMVGNG
jgi:pSer/pThr/pTyr-binding forkhead associated (FHA) protein